MGPIGLPSCYTPGGMGGRLNWIVGMFGIAIGGLLFFHLFGTTWSNKCDPGNAQFQLMKQDGVVVFKPDGQLFTWENDDADNLWLCSNANLSVSHVGPNVKAIYEATRQDMTANGWTELGALPNKDFAVYEKVSGGVKLSAVVQKQAFWVEVDMSAPGLHIGEFGF